MNSVRAFIAVDVGEEIRAHLDGLQRKLKKVHANVRWVKPGNIHLTLAFLGNLPAESLQYQLTRDSNPSPDKGL